MAPTKSGSDDLLSASISGLRDFVSDAAQFVRECERPNREGKENTYYIYNDRMLGGVE